MARRGGNTPKCVDEKRRQLPIYQHYTLSPGKTKSHHPEAKCVHCLKEFVCGSKQRLIRHIRKCNSITNAEQIIAETLNTLARNSATGQLNHSILEASNLLPSQISQIQHSATQHLVGQAINQNTSTVSTANGNNSNNHNTSGSNSDQSAATTSYGVTSSLNDSAPAKKPQKRGRKPANHAAVGPGIHVTTGMDGKTHFAPANQLPQGSGQSLPQLISPVHNGRGGQLNYAYQSAMITNSNPASTITAPGAHIGTAHLPCATSNLHSSPFKLNPEVIDKTYLRLVITRNLPLSLCDTKEFQAWIKTFANDYKPPSSINLLEQNLKHEAQLARQRVSNIIIKTSKKTINLELHSLSDIIRGHSWYAMIATVDHRRFLISVQNLSSRSRSSPANQSVVMSPEKLLKLFIDDCIKRVGSDRVNSLLLTGKLETENSIVSRARHSLYTTHPSIVTYHCWWHYTNLLCSDVVAGNEVFLRVLRDSNQVIDYINKRPQLSSNLEKFTPFVGAPGTLHRKRDDYRWYSHLVCYLFEYVNKNKEAIIQILEDYSSSKISSDNNNNSNDTLATDTAQQNAQLDSNISTQQTLQVTFCQEELLLTRVKSTVASDNYWANLKSALAYLRSFRDVVALAQNITTNNADFTNQVPPAISSVTCNNLSLSDYMNWFLNYGKSLIDCWKESADSHKYQLMRSFFHRFNSSFNDFKLLFAAYLLNPRYRCAYMTQKAKDCAIEEILNIASEFMPEESDGHTIFDQWQLYLKREQPYDTVFDENRSTPLEWWMSLPCAESIRRVALRILRLKAFSSPKPETIFSQLYFYEDEMRTNLNDSTFEDLAILRYFYDNEDKIGQPGFHGSAHNSSSVAINVNGVANGFIDRTLVGQVHNEYFAEAAEPVGLLPDGPLESPTVPNGEPVGETIEKFAGSFTTVAESYADDNLQMNVDNHQGMTCSVSLDSLAGFGQFSFYIDYDDSGIQIIEEPTEKKRRKWTAQEILSKVQSNNHHNNNNHAIDGK